MPKPCFRFVSLLSALCLPSLAAPALVWAGGFELGANGTEALGRGGAFTAKADSPLALEYNVAGLAQSRGTRLLYDNNLVFSQYAFARAGGDRLSAPSPDRRQNQPALLRAVVWHQHDFGFFQRVTFAIGAFGPSSVGKRNFRLFAASGRSATSRAGPLRRRGHRSADRSADAGRGRAGASPDRPRLLWAVCGGSSTSRAPPPRPAGSRRDVSQKCGLRDAVRGCGLRCLYSRASAELGQLRAAARRAHAPVRWSASSGANLKTAVNLGTKPITATGTVSASEPASIAGFGVGADRMDARFIARLPWVLRLGLRYAWNKGGRELADVEFNAIYESWGQWEGSDNQLTLVNPPVLINGGMPIDIRLAHNYRDTVGLRLGFAASGLW